MKTLLLLLIPILSFSQEEATVHFYYGSAQMLGAEILYHPKNTESFFIGGGFSGALNQRKADGNAEYSRITDYDRRQTKIGHLNEQWCSLYVTSSFGFLGSVLVKYKTGLAVYNKKVTFESGTYQYNKIESVLYRPLIGIGAMYSISKDYGIEIGADTFNKITIGITANF